MIEAHHSAEKKDPRREGMTPHNFITKLVEDFKIQTVFYPGSGSDFTLENVFPSDGIVYLDEDKSDAREFRKGNRGEGYKGHFIRGDMEQAPFKDEAFDALYIQDIHATKNELNDIIRTVKKDGVVIFSMDDCEEGDMDDLDEVRRHPQLKKLDLNYKSGMFHVFQKGEAVPGVIDKMYINPKDYTPEQIDGFNDERLVTMFEAQMERDGAEPDLESGTLLFSQRQKDFAEFEQHMRELPNLIDAISKLRLFSRNDNE